MKIYKPMAKMLGWVRPQVSWELLIDAKSFPDCFMVTKEFAEVGFFILLIY